MSKKNTTISEEEFREFYRSLPESSKEYLMNNAKHMSYEAFIAYMTGLTHGMKEVLETINPNLKGILDKLLILPLILDC